MVTEIIKRDGTLAQFDKKKIINAILKAYEDIYEENADNSVFTIALNIGSDIEEMELEEGDYLSVEDIQDIVEDRLMDINKPVAKSYINYRYLHGLIRQSNTTDKSIKELINGESTYWNEENSNKNAKIVTVQRDYIAGITSTDIARRFLLPKDIVEAHDEGIIHFHDMDYFAQKSLHNCELANLEDMLQNGTVINGVMIEKPHRLLTAMTIATQIITAITSSSYGGCTVTSSHLAPFVRDSYNYYLDKYRNYGLDENKIEEFAKKDLKKEINDAVQTFNYQCNSMTNTNGQSPFLSVALYINENPEYEKENVMLIEEFLKQRNQGFKNEAGIYVTPAFPKLLYFLDENNCNENTEYWWLTKLAAKCTAKRLVPDYISAKIMKRDKINSNGQGDVYPCMGKQSYSSCKTSLTMLNRCA